MNQLELIAIAILLFHPGISIAGIEEYPDKVTVVSIVSSMNLTTQSALFYDPGTDTTKPLLIALHTRSSHYDQGGGEVGLRPLELRTPSGSALQSVRWLTALCIAK